MAEPVVATYSIAACDLAAGQWGVATQSKFLAVGSVVPWAEPHVGAIATQAYANPRYGHDGLALLRDGASAEDVVAHLTTADEGREHRQVGVVDAQGGSATFTGSQCFDWAGGLTGPGFAAQGNILVGEETVAALAATFTATTGRPLAARLLECLAAAQAAGGDRRGQQSAALLVVERDGGYAGLSDVLVDLRVDDHARPIAELTRLHGSHELLFGKTPRDEWIELNDTLRTELTERLVKLGYDGGLEQALAAWADTENLEERVDGAETIDPVVLEELPRTVSDRGYEILSIDDLDRYPTTAGSQILRPLRRRLGFRPFGLNVWVGEQPGDHVIEPHREPKGPEELYVVLRGTARFTVDEETFDAPVGTLVHVPPDTFREATASAAGTTVLAMGAKAGEAFTPSPWEDFYIAYAELRAGNPEAGRAAMELALASDPAAWQGPFNAACFEALAGETDAALEHLRHAMELDAAEVRRYASTDSDLDSIRADPRFAEILE